jgi:imidazoleglycerol-phosphate dehydratase
MSRSPNGVRFTEYDRETHETRVQIVLDLDGGARQDISVGVAFFDRLLSLFAFHAQFDLGIKTEGVPDIDEHVIVEDVAFALGRAIKEALRSSEQVVRFADCTTAIDDALILVAVDIGGRGSASVDANFKREMIGDFALENIALCIKSLSAGSGVTIHARQLAGENAFHACEALFIGLGRAIHMATRVAERPNTKSGLN